MANSGAETVTYEDESLFQYSWEDHQQICLSQKLELIRRAHELRHIPDEVWRERLNIVDKYGSRVNERHLLPMDCPVRVYLQGWRASGASQSVVLIYTWEEHCAKALPDKLNEMRMERGMPLVEWEHWLRITSCNASVLNSRLAIPLEQFPVTVYLLGIISDDIQSLTKSENPNSRVLQAFPSDPVGVHILILEASRSPDAFRQALSSSLPLKGVQQKLFNAGYVGPDCEFRLANGGKGPKLFVRPDNAALVINHLRAQGAHFKGGTILLDDMRPRHIITETEFEPAVKAALDNLDPDLRIRPKFKADLSIHRPYRFVVEDTFINITVSSSTASSMQKTIKSSGAKIGVNPRAKEEAWKRKQQKLGSPSSEPSSSLSQSLPVSTDSQSQASSSLSQTQAMTDLAIEDTHVNQTLPAIGEAIPEERDKDSIHDSDSVAPTEIDEEEPDSQRKESSLELTRNT